MRPDDKPKQTGEGYEDPKLFVVIGDEVFPRTGLETAFVDYTGKENETIKNDSINNGSKWLGAVVCSCDKVRVVSCGCVSYKPCNCHGHTVTKSSSSSRGSSRGSSSGRSGCRCAPVH